MDFVVTDYGAAGDGETHDTEAIQRAIDACTASGGGRVVIPAGATCLTGSLELKSGVDLFVDRGAVLANCPHWHHVTARGRVGALSAGVVSDITEESGSFIWATGATDIALTGAGTVDGGGRHYVAEDLGEIYRMPNSRPFCVFLRDCRRVTIRDTRFRDAALWTLRLTGCEDVTIDALDVHADPKVPNADGLDLDACRRVTVSNCRIDTPDDAISIKTCEEFECGPAEDIVISNCVLKSRSSAVVVGVDAREPIRNVVVRGCVVRASHRGLSVNLGQASTYENILFSDILVEALLDDDAWWGCGEPIYVSAAPWHDKVGTARSIVFDGIRCRSENSIYLDAVRPGLVSDIVLRNVTLEIVHESGRRAGRFDRRPWSGPEPLYLHATDGIYINNIDGVLLDGCSVMFHGDAGHFGQALRVEGHTDITIRDFRGVSPR